MPILFLLTLVACVAIAALRGVESHSLEGALRLLPVLAAIVLVALARDLLARTRMTAYARMPRALRVRYALELAFFRWLDPSLEGHPDRVPLTLRDVHSARRACSPAQVSQIDHLTDLIGRCGRDTAAVERAFKDCLRAAPPNLGAPTYRRRILPEYLAKKAPLVAATFVVLWRVASRGNASLHDAAEWLMVFTALRVGLSLACLLEGMWLVRTRTQTFRIVFLTDQSVDHLANRAAVRFYSELGHTLAMFIDPPEVAFSGILEWFGAERSQFRARGRRGRSKPSAPMQTC